MLSYKSKKLTIDNEQLTIKESPAGMIQKLKAMKNDQMQNCVRLISNHPEGIPQLSIVNCQFSIHPISRSGVVVGRPHNHIQT